MVFPMQSSNFTPVPIDVVVLNEHSSERNCCMIKLGLDDETLYHTESIRNSQLYYTMQSLAHQVSNKPTVLMMMFQPQIQKLEVCSAKNLASSNLAWVMKYFIEIQIYRT